ncbi:hypothetical protein KDL01_34850, partial [Actinospica durhamensis]
MNEPPAEAEPEPEELEAHAEEARPSVATADVARTVRRVAPVGAVCAGLAADIIYSLEEGGDAG